MISIITEYYGAYGRARMTPGRRALPRRPLPSVYFRKPVKPHNRDDLSDDAPAAKRIHRQHVVKHKPHHTVGFRPTVGKALTPRPHKS